MKPVDIHQGIDSALLLLQNRLKKVPEQPQIEIIKEYGNLPQVECYAGQLNQVFMSLLTNAIDVLESLVNSPDKRTHPQIRIRTEIPNDEQVLISIADNGPGMTEEIRKRIFDPFFTTKAVGKGSGMGLSISYQIIVEKHRGEFKCISAPGQGAEFIITIPLQQRSL
jgi:signal transduction histidine kinase